jgi:hypothetical protein
LLEADLALAKELSHARDAMFEHGPGRVELADEAKGNLAVPQLIETGGIAWQNGVEVLADLASERRTFANQVAAMPNAQLQLPPSLGQSVFQKREAVYGSTMNGLEIVVVGFVAGVSGLPELLGGEGMHQACLESGFGKSIFDGMVIAAGTFDGDQTIAQAELAQGGADAGNGGIEFNAVVRHLGRRDEYFAVEIGEHPLGPRFGAIDADDAEMFRTHLLHAGMNDAARFL